MDTINVKYTRFGIILLCIISFFPVLNAGFVNYDDPEYVINNNYIKHFTIDNIWAIFSGKATILYVPLTIFSYLIEYCFFGLNAKAFHFFNLLLHIVNCLLLLKILLKLQIKERNLIFVVLLFFSINPLITESVCWITERKDVLYTFFYLLAVIQFLKYNQTKNTKPLLFCFVYFVLSCFSKPMAISLPVLLSIFVIYKNNGFSFKNLMPLLPFYIVAFIFAMVSILAIQHGTSTVRELAAYSFPEKVFLILSEIGYYFFKPFFPFNQQLIHLFPESGKLFSNHLLLIYCFLSFIITAIVIWLYSIKKNKIIPALFILWLVFMAPVLQIYPNTHSYVSERYFYVSLIFPVIIFYLFLQYLKIPQTYFKQTIIILTTCLIVLTFKRSLVWKDSETLFVNELKTTPNNSYALNNLGQYYNSKGQFTRAMPLLKKAVFLEPSNGLYLTNYGWSLAATGKTDSAIVYFEGSLQFKKNNFEAFNNLGICYMQLNLHNKALECFLKAEKLQPNNNEVLYNLGAYYLKIGDKEKARPFIKKAYYFGNKNAEKYLNY